MTLDPPSVAYTQTGNAVESGFHAACPGGFERTVRSVEPKIHASGKQTRPSDIVVGDMDDGNRFAKGRSRFKDSPDNSLPVFVPGMGLPSEHDLERTGILADGA